MKISSRRKEEFLWGLLVPTFLIIGTELIHLFDFIFYLFPVLLIAGFIYSLFWKRWGVTSGLVAFVFLAYMFRGIKFISVFWSWVMADGEIIKRLLK